MSSYEMSETDTVGKKGVEIIEKYLKTLPETIDVINVEDNHEYRKKDIDIIWKRNVEEQVIETTIEVKTDRYTHTGNYFLETVSNESKGTIGCFLYTEADFVYYYFSGLNELHIMPMPESRDWFIRNMEQFNERKTSTPIGNDKYITVGRLVSRSKMLNEVKNINVVNL